MVLVACIAAAKNDGEEGLGMTKIKGPSVESASVCAGEDESGSDLTMAGKREEARAVVMTRQRCAGV